MFIFGLGYVAKRIAKKLLIEGWQVDATGRDGNISFDDERAVQRALEGASRILSSVPPDRESGCDPVLERYRAALEGKWLGYLSSTGVYGDTEGAWVDETAATGTGRRGARSDCDRQWLDIGAHVFRLPGIYGPGRSAIDRVKAGKARRLDLPSQVFSRVHVDDIVSGVIAAIEREAPACAYNLSYDLPASGNAVIEDACRLLGVKPPPIETIDEAGLSEVARGFYAENRRASNGKAKRVLGWKPQYPSYREGLQSLI